MFSRQVLGGVPRILSLGGWARERRLQYNREAWVGRAVAGGGHVHHGIRPGVRGVATLPSGGLRPMGRLTIRPLVLVPYVQLALREVHYLVRQPATPGCLLPLFRNQEGATGAGDLALVHDDFPGYQAHPRLVASRI